MNQSGSSLDDVFPTCPRYAKPMAEAVTADAAKAFAKKGGQGNVGDEKDSGGSDPGGGSDGAG